MVTDKKGINVGDIIDLKIEAIGSKGDGLAKVNGLVIFVPDTTEGEKVKVKITKRLEKVAFAEKIESSERDEETTEESEEESEKEDIEENYSDTEEESEKED